VALPFIVAAVVGAACASDAGVRGALRYRLTLVLSDPARRLPPSVIHRASAEAHDIWSSYGVSVETDDRPGCAAAAGTMRITIEVERRLNAPRRVAVLRLGFVRFAPSGVADPVLWLFYDEIAHLIEDASVGGKRLDAWGLPVRDDVTGRAVGRVIAHEIGHLLLGSGHSAGLMRPRFRSVELVEPALLRFQLPDSDLARLSRALATLPAAGPSKRPE
jgi:hypothetical protein